MKINANSATKKQHRKNHEKIRSWTLHGSILEGLGKLLGAIGALLGAMLAFLGRHWTLLWRLFGLMGASDLIWGGVWEALEGFLGSLGEDFEGILGGYLRFRDPALSRQLARLLGRQVRSKWAPRSLFFSHFFARCFEVAFFSVFRWFFNGFWEVWGWIWECSG